MTELMAINAVATLEQHEDPLFHTMKEKLQQYDGTRIQFEEAFSIYRVPASIIKADPSAYEPQVVSIGPYHRQNPKLHAMEDHKWRYMHNLLRRTAQRRSSFNATLKLCIDKVKQSEARARTCYKVPFYISNYEFIMMLVLDGCFVIELFITSYGDAAEDDLIYAIPWMFPAIWTDLLKLENQIPFFILEDLFNIVVTTELTPTYPSLKDLAFRFLEVGPLTIMDPFNEEGSLTRVVEEKVHHLLHFYHILLQPLSADHADASTRRRQSALRSVLQKMKTYVMPHFLRSKTEGLVPRYAIELHNTIPCAVELCEAGIKFKTTKRGHHRTALNVNFKDGILHIPSLSIVGSINPVFRNLLAFEQFCPNNSHYVTTYITFLDSLVNTAKDVSVLQQFGVIENLLGNEDELAQLINQLGRDAVICARCHYLRGVFRKKAVKFQQDYTEIDAANAGSPPIRCCAEGAM